MRRSISLALILTGVMPAAASAAELDPGADALVRTFFQQLQANHVAAAYNGLFAGTLLVKRPLDMDAMVAQTSAVLSVYGKVVGWELGSTEEISPSYKQALYVLKTENGPLFFKFDVYRADTRWIANRVYFNDVYANLPK